MKKLFQFHVVLCLIEFTSAYPYPKLENDELHKNKNVVTLHITILFLTYYNNCIILHIYLNQFKQQ